MAAAYCGESLETQARAREVKAYSLASGQVVCTGGASYPVGSCRRWATNWAP